MLAKFYELVYTYSMQIANSTQAQKVQRVAVTNSTIIKNSTMLKNSTVDKKQHACKILRAVL